MNSNNSPNSYGSTGWGFQYLLAGEIRPSYSTLVFPYIKSKVIFHCPTIIGLQPDAPINYVFADYRSWCEPSTDDPYAGCDPDQQLYSQGDLGGKGLASVQKPSEHVMLFEDCSWLLKTGI